jgi:hypothetical protein
MSASKLGGETEKKGENYGFVDGLICFQVLDVCAGRLVVEDL